VAWGRIVLLFFPLSTEKSTDTYLRTNDVNMTYINMEVNKNFGINCQ
jgi:hypothetical protein